MNSLLFTFLLCIGMIFSTYSQSKIQYGVNRDLTFDQISSSQLNSNNQVYIIQIGYNNTIKADFKTNNSKSNYFQDGDHNNINLNITAKTFQGFIDQTGDNNRIFDHIYEPSSDISLNLTQNGKNNHFERHGSNSIGEKLEFRMNGNDKSIIVRNFK